MFKVFSKIPAIMTILLLPYISTGALAQSLDGNGAQPANLAPSKIKLLETSQVDAALSNDSRLDRTSIWAYAKPSSSAAKTNKKINVELMRIVSRNKRWLKVSTIAPQRVWIESKYANLIGDLAFIQNKSAPAFLSTDTSSTMAENRVGSISADKVVKIDSRDGDWLYVTPLESFALWVITDEYNDALNKLRVPDAIATPQNPNKTKVANTRSTPFVRPQQRQLTTTVDTVSAKVQTKVTAPAPNKALTLKTQKPKNSTTLAEIKPFDEYVNWLCEQSSDAKLLQLSSFRDIAALEFYVDRHKQLSANQLHRARSVNGEWYYLIYGSHPDSEEAQKVRKEIGIENAVIRSAALLQKSRCST